MGALSRPWRYPAAPAKGRAAGQARAGRGGPGSSPGATVRSEVTLSGTIEPDRSARLAAQVDGEVVALEVREGTAVRAGQVLVRIDPSRLAAALDEARADAWPPGPSWRMAAVCWSVTALFSNARASARNAWRSPRPTFLRLEAAEARAQSARRRPRSPAGRYRGQSALRRLRPRAQRRAGRRR
ncbi:MAG: biotin/lipoyl-binding protein [Marinilabiliales bacterium]|nr:biotin/lipoyl-binding protein [Marinilabiliales bacterium]